MSASVSLCMIVRNESAQLQACLAPVMELVDEAVVVDTGSDDPTPGVARSMGAQVYDLAWPDSFAAARNASIHYATGDWIFWLDADDRIDDANRERLRRLFASLGESDLAYRMRSASRKAPGSRDYVVSDHVRLFRRQPDIRWRYRVHEQILPAIVQAGGRVVWSDVMIEHLGYSDSAVRTQKHERNRQLLERDLQEHPDDPFVLFNLGWTLHVLGQTEAAIPHLYQSLRRCSAEVRFKPPRERVYGVLASALTRAGRTGEALHVHAQARSEGGISLESRYAEATGQLARGEYALAESLFRDLRRAIASITGEHPYRDLQREVDRHLSQICLRQRRYSDAETFLTELLSLHPDDSAAAIHLGEVYLAQRRLADLEGWIQRLSRTPSHGRDADFLVARLHLARHEFPEALARTDSLLRQFPRSVHLHGLRAEILWCQADRQAAAAAFREVLALDPQHARARQALQALS
jgi:predicted Zn-dependent protease